MADKDEDSAKPATAHVLMIDIVGYSILRHDQQTNLTDRLSEIVRSTPRFRIADVGGKVVLVSIAGEMALIFFADAEPVMECAEQIANRLKESPDIKVRMAIASGHVTFDVTRDQRNAQGAGIDFARRLVDCGDSGHILLSRRVAYDLASIARWNENLYELGDCETNNGDKVALVNFYTDQIGNRETPTRLKRAQKEAARKAKLDAIRVPVIGSLVAICLVAGIVRAFLHERKVTAPLPVSAPEKSIAVLPFVDLSPGHDQEYFCDGTSEEILDALAKSDGLRVVARNSSFSLKGKDLEVGEIARKLNVTTVLEGTFRREGNHVRIVAQLINAHDGLRLWSQTFERELQDIVGVQEEIIRAVTESLKVKPAAPRGRPEQNAAAYDLYLQGLLFSNNHDEANLRKSLARFERALELDPNFGRAWIGVARDWYRLADAYVKPADAYPHMQAAASKALALNENDAEARCYLAEAKRILAWDIKGSEADVQHALKINPNLVLAHCIYALVRGARADRDGYLDEMRKAVALDPLSPMMSNAYVSALVRADRLEDALLEAKRTLEIDSNYVYFEPALALVYREQGKLQDALSIYLRLQQTRQHPDDDGLAITYARLGRKDEAAKILDELIHETGTRYIAPERIAAIYVALGDHDEAFRWLNRGIEEHSARIHEVAFARQYRPLRSDPRFPEFLRRIGLDPEVFVNR